MRLGGGVEHGQALSAKGSEPDIVVGTARHGFQLHDLAAQHGVVANREAGGTLNADARQHGIVIAQRRGSLENAAHGGAIDGLAFRIEHLQDRIER